MFEGLYELASIDNCTGARCLIIVLPLCNFLAKRWNNYRGGNRAVIIPPFLFLYPLLLPERQTKLKTKYNEEKNGIDLRDSNDDCCCLYGSK